jgi:hypothetical protein
MERAMRMTTCLVLALLAGCDGNSILEGQWRPGAGASTVDPDYGPIEAYLSDAQKTLFPGFISGSLRTIPINRGFFEGKPMSYWLVASQNNFPAPKSTSSLYVFCKTDDKACPLIDGAWNDAELIGNPVVDSIPGDPSYSPFHEVVVVRVPGSYQANAMKTVDSIKSQFDQGIVSLENLLITDEAILRNSEPAPAIINAPVIVDGTYLQGNGADLFDQPGVKSLVIPTKIAWYKDQRVKYLDFSVGEGFFPAQKNGLGQDVMPTQPGWIIHRACPESATPSVCDLVGDTGSLDPNNILALDGVAVVGRQPVFELMLSLTANQNIDLDGDGEIISSNNVLAALGPASLGLGPINPRDALYSPLQELMSTQVAAASDAMFKLLDTEMSMKAPTIQVRGVADVRFYEGTGDLTVPIDIPEALMLVKGGAPPIAANQGNLFVNGPTQLPAPQ